MQDATRAGIAPRAVRASRGWDWIAEGFGLFKRAPGIWIAMLLIWIVIYVVAALIPLGGLATALFGATFQAGWMLGCKALDDGTELKIEHLFAGFRGAQLGQ